MSAELNREGVDEPVITSAGSRQSVWGSKAGRQIATFVQCLQPIPNDANRDAPVTLEATSPVYGDQ